ncbi:hypothetical protein COV82_06370, partial [Candidatus Peregrinibacteria bacterium CG11_big_fil_rev_8_21_14_0_20_46_8]
HSIIKISGAIIAFLFLAQFQDLVNILAPNASTGRLIANAHTLYNIAISVIALPLIPYIAASTKYFVFGRPEKREELAYLDETSLADPGTALDQADRALSDMHSQICGYLKKIETNFLTKQKLDPSLLFELGAQVQQYEYRITHYLQKLAEQNLTKAQSQQLARTIRILHELTRMNDYIMKMSEIANEKIREDIHFSPLDKRDLRNLFKALDPVIQKVQILIHKPDRKTAENVMTRYEEIRTLRDGIRKKIQSRFASHKTTLATMHAFIDVLNALEEIAKKSSNIAETVRSA